MAADAPSVRHSEVHDDARGIEATVAATQHGTPLAERNQFDGKNIVAVDQYMCEGGKAIAEIKVWRRLEELQLGAIEDRYGLGQRLFRNAARFGCGERARFGIEAWRPERLVCNGCRAANDSKACRYKRGDQQWRMGIDHEHLRSMQDSLKL